MLEDADLIVDNTATGSTLEANNLRIVGELMKELGALGILERENSTVLNGALLGVARDVAGTTRDAIDDAGSDQDLEADLEGLEAVLGHADPR